MIRGLEILQSLQLVYRLHDRLIPLIVEVLFCILAMSYLTLQLQHNKVIQCDLSLDREVRLKKPFHYRSPLATKKVQQRPRPLTKIHADSGP